MSDKLYVPEFMRIAHSRFKATNSTSLQLPLSMPRSHLAFVAPT